MCDKRDAISGFNFFDALVWQPGKREVGFSFSANNNHLERKNIQNHHNLTGFLGHINQNMREKYDIKWCPPLS